MLPSFTSSRIILITSMTMNGPKVVNADFLEGVDSLVEV